MDSLGPKLLQAAKFAGYSIWNKILIPVSYIFSFSLNAALSILAPGIVLISIAYEYLIYFPVVFVTAVLHSIYPFYVFVTATVIVAVCLGYGAKRLTLLAQTALQPSLGKPNSHSENT